MNSIELFAKFGNLSPSRKYLYLFGLANHVTKYQAFKLEDEKGVEMAKILYDFIQANAHLFKQPIFDAAQRLFEEIQKAEAEDSNYIERII